MAGFHEIIGHEQLIAHLQSAIVMDKVSHAYIINGPKDSGKMMLAQAFAMALQCETSIRNREGATGSTYFRHNESLTRITDYDTTPSTPTDGQNGPF